MSYREALGSSLNVPAVRVAEAHGIDRLARLLSDAGMTTVDPEGELDLSLALGSVPVRLVDLAEAYATLARGGIHLPARTIRGPSGTGERLLRRETAWLVTDMLADRRARTLEFGLETPLDLPFPVAAKTGTSQSFCDNVVVGYTAEVTVAVWVGNFDGRPMRGVLAMRGAAPLFRDAVSAAMEGRPRGLAVRPPGIDEVEVCPLSGDARGPGCPVGRREVVAARHGAQSRCPLHGTAQVADSGPGAAALSIRSPADGTTVRLDPLLPADAQRVLLRAEVTAPEGARVRWEVDGRPISGRGAPLQRSWAPRPGTHRIRALLEVPGGLPPQTDEIHVRVE